MRRVVSLVAVVLGLIGTGVGLGSAGTAAAFAAPWRAKPDAVPGEKVCTIKDSRLVELSGMVATKSGYVVINDGSDYAQREKIFFLDRKCKVKHEVSYPGGGPLDTEDLGLSPDGKTLWVADTGDNLTSPKHRDTIALWSMPLDRSDDPVIHRLTYPDGKHDAEALLFKGDGTPIIVTREPGKSGLYVPTGPLQANKKHGVPLKKVGEVVLPKTDTPNPLAVAGRRVTSGGATAPDGSRVALRTYADAFEWDVTNGDVIKALTSTTPRGTPLPNEPLGESITYTPDGKSFLTVSEVSHLKDTDPTILRYTPSQKVASTQAATDNNDHDGQSWFDGLTVTDITNLIWVVGAVGLVLVAAGVIGIVLARRKPVRDKGPDGGAGPKSGRQVPPRTERQGRGKASAGRSGPGPAARAAAPPPPNGAVNGGSASTGRANPRGRGSGTAPSGGGPSGGGAVYGGGPSGGANHGGGLARPGYGGRARPEGPGGGGYRASGPGGYQGKAQSGRPAPPPSGRGHRPYN